MPDPAPRVPAFDVESSSDLSEPTLFGTSPPSASTYAPEPTELVARRSADALDLGERYRDLGLLGRGGAGEVHRVRDLVLGRAVAMKILLRERQAHPEAEDRFLDEARIVARLQHPGVVPIYDTGRLPDGRPYFTMREVRGLTLADHIAEVHAASATGEWRTSPSGWTLHRLVDAWADLCRAVGYAHRLGVLHRDLKPANAMVTEHGELLVLDWGLGKPVQSGEARAIVTVERSATATRQGAIKGTPAFMPPEQARGATVTASADLYGLGAVLYVILTGRLPYGGDATAVLRAVRARAPAPVRTQGAAPPPEELAALCERAMARDPGQRPQYAEDLANAAQDWLEGITRRQKALALVEQAEASRRHAADLRAQASTLQATAARLLREVPSWAGGEKKRDAWEIEDEGHRRSAAAQQHDEQADQELLAALTHAPDLPEAHCALVRRYRAEHEAIDRAGGDPARVGRLLRAHAERLPASSPERAVQLAWLQGDGELRLQSDPPGAEVALLRYELRERRLEAVPFRDLGRTPLATALPMGSYLALLRHPDRAEARLPVCIGRQETWDNTGEATIRLLRPEQLGPEDRYVPGSWAWLGGDPAVPDTLSRRRVWIDSFVIRRFPFTNGAYLDWLNALVAEGRADEALRHAPRERAGAAEGSGAMVPGFDGARFHLRADADGDIWQPDWPVMLVSWSDAAACASDLARREGLPWRLPSEFEWEKAGRGADGRAFPWGDAFDPSFCAMRHSLDGARRPSSILAFPADISPYGVRGLAGGVRDWCADRYLSEGPANDGQRLVLEPDAEVEGDRCFRGGSWNDSALGSRLAARGRAHASSLYASLGFRLARSV